MKKFTNFMESSAYTMQQAMQTLEVLHKKLQEMDEESYNTVAGQVTPHFGAIYRLINQAADLSYDKKHT